MNTNNGWLDIASAPKDGTEILAWRSDCGQFIASYTSADAFPMTQAELDSWDEETLFAKDWFTQWPQALRLEGSEVPTLWQPLPAAPASPVSTVEQDPKDERRAFEAWGLAGCEMIDDPQSGRMDIARHCAWEAWKARASVAAPAAGDARDAARYRWLRNEVLVDGEVNDSLYVHVDSPEWPTRWALVGDELDTALDAAIAAQRQGDA